MSSSEPQSSRIGPHDYAFSEGIFSFTPHGDVLFEHATELVSLLREHGSPDQPMACLFDMTGGPNPTPPARRVIVEYFRTDKPQLYIATHGASLQLRAMFALVSAAARVVGGYSLNVTHFERRDEAWQYLRKRLSA